MKQDERAPFASALHRARVAAHPPGEYAGQESFMRAGEILDLARRAGVGPGVAVLDLCCGVAGPGRLITAELGCDYLGMDSSASAVGIARDRTAGLPCRFVVGRGPPLPAGTFDVVLLLETMLAFPDKPALLSAVAAALRPGGRFAFTMEEGAPLTPAERAAMPDADTVWLTPLEVMLGDLRDAGLEVRLQRDRTATHLELARSLTTAFTDDRDAIAAQIGTTALDELLAAHRLWIDWMASGRVRKLEFIARAGPA